MQNCWPRTTLFCFKCQKPKQVNDEIVSRVKALASIKIIQFYIAVSWACKSLLQTISLSEYQAKDVVMCSNDKIIKNGSGLRCLSLIGLN